MFLKPDVPFYDKSADCRAPLVLATMGLLNSLEPFRRFLPRLRRCRNDMDAVIVRTPPANFDKIINILLRRV